MFCKCSRLQATIALFNRSTKLIYTNFNRLVLNIVELVNQLNAALGLYDKTYVAFLGITIALLFVGAYGSYTHNRDFLNIFAIILIGAMILMIAGVLGQSIHYSPLGTNVVLVILALAQGELIRRGYH